MVTAKTFCQLKSVVLFLHNFFMTIATFSGNIKYLKYTEIRTHTSYVAFININLEDMNSLNIFARTFVFRKNKKIK